MQVICQPPFVNIGAWQVKFTYCEKLKLAIERRFTLVNFHWFSKSLILKQLTMENAVSHFTVFLEGHVQGVGFRFTTFQLAKGFEVTGYVSNLADGRVQLELEGDRDECLAFIKALAEEMAGFIRDKSQTEKTREPVFRDFKIR
jgi:acylphosphatase